MIESSKRKLQATFASQFNPLQSLEPRTYFAGVSFAVPVTQVSTLPSAGIMADFNADGKADLVSADPAGNVDVSISNGDGTFAAPVVVAVMGAPVTLATGHFDTTGNLDIVAGTTGSPGSVSIIVGNGDGTFLPANDIAALDNNSAVAVGDFNNDGNQDILSTSNSAAPSGNAMLLLGNGTAGAFSQTPFSLPFGSVSAVADGDFNGDGNLDFAVANQLSDSVSVFMGNGDGTFAAPTTYSAGFAAGVAPTSILVSNITGKTLANAKPQLDIITGDGDGTVSYLPNDGDGTFATAVPSDGGGGAIHAIAIADFNKDGRPDLLAIDPESNITALALLGNGDGTFTSSNTLQIGSAGSSATGGDVNGDGLTDVVGISAGNLSSRLNAYTVGSITSTTSVTAASATINAGATDVLTATVTPTVATGSVNFMANGVSIGTANITRGTAVLTGTFNTAGDIVITAIYSGNSIYAPSTATTITLTVAGTPVGAQPLVPVIIRSNLPGALVGGIAVHGSGLVQVTNSTAATIKGTITVNLYASTNGVVDGSSIMLGSSVKKNLSVKSGKSFTTSIGIKILSDTLSVGTYKLIAKTLDPSSTSSVSVTGPSLNVAAPFVALSETFTKIMLAPNLVAGSTSSVTAVIMITNSGNIISSGVTPVNIYVSPDGTPGAGISLNLVKKNLKIAVGKSVTLAVPLKAIPDIAAGVYSVGIQVTDPTAQVTSTVSAKPVNIGAATIDLLSTIVDVPTTAKIGKSIGVTLDVTNAGNVPAKGSLEISFAGSISANGSGATLLSTTKTEINIKPAATRRLRFKVLIPASSVAGDNYLVATLDPTHALNDANLINNVTISLSPITLA